MTTQPRSWLYVPGHRVDRLDKAVVAGADAVVVDLEDAVPTEQKSAARAGAVDLLRRNAGADRLIWVRVNAPGSVEWAADLAALAGTSAAGLRVPKAVDPELVRETAARSGLALQLVIESARGLQAVDELATADPAVRGVGLGETDLAADLRVEEDGLDWARGRVVLACRAAGLPSPVQSVWTQVADLDGLAATSRRARAQGFFGRSIVHPRQIAVVHEVFTPSATEVADAEDVITRAARGRDAGESALLDEHGRFIDPAVVARARVVLDRAVRQAPSTAESERR